MKLTAWFVKFQTLHYKNDVYLVSLTDVMRFIFDLIASPKNTRSKDNET